MTAEIHPTGRGFCWPNQQQELLLKAALLSGNEASAAWSEWASVNDLDEIDHGSYQLLASVERNLRSIGVEHPHLGRMKGVRRRTFLQNQLVLGTLTTVIEEFRAQGIESIVMPSAALGALDYEDPSLRLIEAPGLLIEPDQTAQAIEHLTKAGWGPLSAAPRPLTPAFLNFHSNLKFSNGSATSLSIHWHALRCCCNRTATDEFWTTAEDCSRHGMATRRFDPTGTLLHVCLSGQEWTYAPNIAWLLDATTTLRNQRQPDPDRLCRFVRQQRLTVRLLRALAYIEEAFAVPLPEGLLPALRSIPVSRAEQREYETVTRGYRRRTPISVWHETRQRFRRSGHRSFPAYLAAALRWGWPRTVWGRSAVSLLFRPSGQ